MSFSRWCILKNVLSNPKATAAIQNRLNIVAFGPISRSLKRMKIGEKDIQTMPPINAAKESIGNDERECSSDNFSLEFNIAAELYERGLNWNGSKLH